MKTGIQRISRAKVLADAQLDNAIHASYGGIEATWSAARSATIWATSIALAPNTGAANVSHRGLDQRQDQTSDADECP